MIPLTQHISFLGVYSKEIFRNCMMDTHCGIVSNIKNQKQSRRLSKEFIEYTYIIIKSYAVL